MKRLILLLLLCTFMVGVSAQNSDLWQEVDKLEKTQKYQKAMEIVDKILQNAREQKSTVEWRNALVRKVVLQTALHGYETSVKILHEEVWPDDRESQAILNLFYANTLLHYYNSYSWEINNREKVIANNEIDLKKWNAQEIFSHIHERYFKSYQMRDMLSNLKVKDFPAIIQRNGYPENIRSSMRDFVCYSWAQFLGNSTTWTPEESREIYKLDFDSLLVSPEVRVRLGDSALMGKDHPVKKIIQILDDLYFWNLSIENNESALETQLETIRRLNAAFSESRYKEKLITAITHLLKSYEKYPWWAAGIYEYASFLQQQGKLVLAHDVAKKAHDIYPDNLGGKKCLSLYKSIAAPTFSIESMGIDRKNTKSVVIQHKNMNALYFRIYEVDFNDFLEKPHRYPGSIYTNDLRDIIHKKRPVTMWRTELQDFGDYQHHKTHIRPNVPDNGFYVIAASAKPSFATEENIISGTYLLISDIVTVENHKKDGWEISVVDGTTGKGIDKAEVLLYQYDYNNGCRLTFTKTTDLKGNAFFRIGNQSYFVVARKNGSISFDPNTLYHYNSSYNTQNIGSFIYTDRSIYRPLQKILCKVVTYAGDNRDAQYQTLPNERIEISLLDPNWQVVETKNVTTNDYGTTSTEFDIPQGKPLGYYQIRTKVKEHYNNVSVRVEEYKRPTFEITLEKPEKELRLNHIAEVEGNARYYFGLPVTTGKVFYRVTRIPQYPYWYWWYYDNFPAKGQDEIASGFTALDETGKFKIKFTAEGDDTLPDKEKISYVFQVYAEVIDEGGETRNASSNYNIGFSSVAATISLEDIFVRSEEKVVVNVNRADLNGVPRQGNGSYKIYSLAQPQKTMLPQDFPVVRSSENSTEGDFMRPRWERQRTLSEYLFAFKDENSVLEGNLKHDAKGKAQIKIDELAAGAYRIRYTTTDSFGTPCEAQKEFVVAENNTNLSIPIFLLSQKNTAKVGEKAVFFLGSGIKNQSLLLEIHQNGHMLQKEFIEDASQTKIFEVNITEKYRGGFSVRLHGVHDYRYYTVVENIWVPWDNKELKISFETFRDTLQPGQSETWTVKVQGPNAENVAAEVLAYMYDRSLDFFAAHNPPSPKTLYPQKFGTEYTRHNLFNRYFYSIFSQGYYTIPNSPHYSADSFIVYNSYAIGGPGSRLSKQRFTRFAHAEGLLGSSSEVSEDTMALDAAAPSPDAVATNTAIVVNQKAQVQGGQAPGGETEKIRSNFSETAFFQPHLYTEKDGTVKIQFSVPDSVTEWKVYIHAVTTDLQYMSANESTVTKKDLMVRPYVPRFFREGDEAVLKAVINNATMKEMHGKVTLTILDAETEQDRSKDFGLSQSELTWTAKGNLSTNVSWKLKAPSSLGSYLFKVVAATDNFSDGELRPVPVLPSRIHLSQSRFVTLKDDDIRIMEIEDLKNADSDTSMIHDSLVVNVNGQLIYTVLKALPYLTEYPYECVEQTLNRFLSTGMVTSLYDQYPAIKAMAQEFSKRETQLDSWNQKDANRSLALSETPWLVTAKGGSSENLINVLNDKIARSQREISLQKLRKAQLGDGAFPWWTGGPASAYMTLYLLNGFARAREFGVDVPEDMIQNAWKYMGNYFRDYYQGRMIKENYGYEFITFLNYVLSCYETKHYNGAFSATERQEMLDYGFKHWQDHSPYLKGLLSLTLERMDRHNDAVLVIESIMDSSITKQDQGTFWAPEDRGWLWYNDTIESHAFILRALMEVKPNDKEHLDGLVLWLLLNKKMNQWKSTRATAEVIYSLATFMKKEGSLAIKENALVKIGNTTHNFTFEPDKYEGGQKQVVVEKEQIKPEKMWRIAVAKQGKGYMFASMNWHYSTEKMPEEARGDFLKVTRQYYLRKHQGSEYVLIPFKDIQNINVGDQVEVHLSIRAKHPMEYVHLQDPRGAGFEPENQVSRHRWEYGIVWYEEIRDSGANFFFENLPQGEYNFTYRIRANMEGTFRVGPATLQSMYAPEFTAFSSGKNIDIEAAK